MIFNEVTKRLFDSAVKKLQGNIDNIQTTSARTMQANGWYRIAYLDGNTQIPSNSCFITLKKSSSRGESHLLRLEATNLGAKFNIISSRVDDAVQFHTIKKIRYTYDSAKSYIEVYCSSAISTYGFTATVFDILNVYETPWKPLNFVDTSETVDGVTVTTTYDILANASPVTDLDLVRLEGTESLSTSILEKALEVEDGVHNFRFNGGYTGDDLPQTNYRYGMATIYKRSASLITVVLWGRTNYNPQFNTYGSGAWSGWQTFATTADLTTALANYLPIVNGEVVASNILPLKVKNSASDSCYTRYSGKDGTLGFLGFSGTNTLFALNKDGGNLGEILHTGNSAKVLFTESDAAAPSDTTALWAHL